MKNKLIGIIYDISLMLLAIPLLVINADKLHKAFSIINCINTILMVILITLLEVDLINKGDK